MKNYKELSLKYLKRNNVFKNCFVAFISGGMLALFSQFMLTILITYFSIEKTMASTIIVVFIIALSSLLTGLGVYDVLAKYCGAGLFIPISGFANALTCCALEAKNEGLIYGIGSNMFKLAGSVITYGIVSVYILGLIRILLNI